MKSVNKVTLLGNVTRAPELKATTGGQSVCTFGIATNRVWKDQNGEKRSLPEYHNLVAWGGLAEFCQQHIKKGKPLYIEGYLKTRSWDGNEGAKIFRTEVVVEDVVLLGSKGDSPTPIAVPDQAADEGDHYNDVPMDDDPMALSSDPLDDLPNG